jgi:hypothetical protein
MAGLKAVRSKSPKLERASLLDKTNSKKILNQIRIAHSRLLGIRWSSYTRAISSDRYSWSSAQLRDDRSLTS